MSEFNLSQTKIREELIYLLGFLEGAGVSQKLGDLPEIKKFLQQEDENN